MSSHEKLNADASTIYHGALLVVVWDGISL